MRCGDSKALAESNDWNCHLRREEGGKGGRRCCGQGLQQHKFGVVRLLRWAEAGCTGHY